MESAQNRVYQSLPIATKEGFGITCKGDYNPKDYTVSVSFGKDGMYSKFWYAYCRLCSNNNKLKASYWDIYPDKLPEEVSINNLMENWDKLNLSWNQQEVLGCILPNNDTDSIITNAKLILRPEKHWNSVHNLGKINPQKSALQRSLKTFIQKEASKEETPLSSQANTELELVVVGNAPTPSSENPCQSAKKRAASGKKTKFHHKFSSSQSTIVAHFDPKINMVGYSPTNKLEKLALGHTLKTIHLGCNSAASDTTIIKFYQSGLDTLREYHQNFVKDLAGSSSNTLLPPIVTLNDKNIHHGVKAIVEAYQKLDKSEDNPY